MAAETAYLCDYPACLTRGCDKACNAALSPAEQTRSQKLKAAGFTRRKTGKSAGGLYREPDAPSKAASVEPAEAGDQMNKTAAQP